MQPESSSCPITAKIKNGMTSHSAVENPAFAGMTKL